MCRVIRYSHSYCFGQTNALYPKLYVDWHESLKLSAILLPADEVQKFLPRFSGRLQAAEHATGGSNCSGLLYPTHHHAEMTGLYNDGDALRLEYFGEGKGDLFCEPFLDLESPGEHFDHSSDLGETNYSAVGNICDVHLALLARNRFGTGSLIIPSQRMARGGARKAKRTQYLSR